VLPLLRASALVPPPSGPPSAAERTAHSEHLAPLLEEMQQVARLEPAGTEW
jgi:hypothetical protein